MGVLSPNREAAPLARPAGALSARVVYMRVSVSTLNGATIVHESADDQLGSWLSRAAHAVGHVATNVGKAVTKAAKDTGHAVGKVADNKIVQGITAGALALTGVGAPLAAGIVAAEAGGGALLKPHGNIGGALRGAVAGAIEGGGASLVNSALAKVPGVATIEQAPVAAFKRLAMGTATGSSDATPAPAMAAPATPADVTARPVPVVADAPPIAAPSAPAVSSRTTPDFLAQFVDGALPKPAATPAAPTNQGDTMSYDILAHLLGTDRAKVIEGGAAALPDTIKGVTGPASTVLQRVSGATAEVAQRTNAAAMNLAPAPSGIGATIKAHPVAVAAAAAGALYLIARR